MLALALKERNQPLLISEYPDPAAGAAEAIVRVRAAALNHRDLFISQGKYAGLKYPIIPGSDGSGIVQAVGDAADQHWIGKEVVIYPALHWGDDPLHQHPNQFKILGLPDDGTLAQLVRVPAANLFPKPAHLSFEEAAALPLAALTAYRALFTRGSLRSGEKILITGIGGGVALFALQFALAAGAEVFVSSGEIDKISRAVALGAKGGVNYKDADWIDQIKNQAGQPDLIVDGAGGDGVNQLLDLVKPGGRVVFYGATRGAAHEIEMRRIFWKQLTVLGSTMGTADDFRGMLELVNKNGLKPIIDQVYDFDSAAQAMKRMEDGKQFGKIVIRIG